MRQSSRFRTRSGARSGSPSSSPGRFPPRTSGLTWRRASRSTKSPEDSYSSTRSRARRTVKSRRENFVTSYPDRRPPGKRRPRTQEERSERSRRQILDAALKLFSHRGYGATSVQEIAEAAGLSKGNVYHHFPDKETVFRALLDRYFQAMSQPEFPFNQALATGTFPENLEQIGRAARDMVSD